jgi:hypothetical protein
MAGVKDKLGDVPFELPRLVAPTNAAELDEA